MIKDKIEDFTTKIADYNEAIKEGERLLGALIEYDKKTINKTFFEKYFTLRHDKESLEWASGKKEGDARTDWKGNIVTDFKLSPPTYSFQKGKQIYLYKSYRIEDIESNQREYIEQKTREAIDQLCKNRDYCITKRDALKNFKLEAFKKDYKKLLAQYNGDSIASDVHKEIDYLG